MRPTRRQAAAGLIAAGFAPFSVVRAAAAGPLLIPPSGEVITDDPPTQVDTGLDGFQHMLAPVAINGQGPFQFLIDTGANVSCVSRDLADRLKLAPGPAQRVHSVVGSRERPSVLIDRLQVGDRNRKAVNAPALPLGGKGIDGVLGVDWLKGQRLVLGFKAKTMQITRSRIDNDAVGAVVVPARRRLGQLTIIDADLNGHRISAMIDSGSQTTICNGPLRSLVAEAETRKGDIITHERVGLETLTGEPFTGEMLYLPFMRLGGLHFGNVPVVYADMHVFELWGLKSTPAIVLGMDLLAQFATVSLDFGQSRVRFELSDTQAGRA